MNKKGKGESPWEKIVGVWQSVGFIGFLIVEICVPIVFLLLIMYLSSSL
jgi:hypothetical protein